MLDWPSFLSSHGIAWTDSDPRSTKGNVIAPCPFCGSHMPPAMSISTGGKGWRCWRRPDEHFGRSPVKLIAAYTGMSIEQAAQIAGLGRTLPTEFIGHVRGLLEPEKIDKPKPAMLHLPKSFNKFSGLPSSKPFVNYLIRRGFTQGDVRQMTRVYDVYYCLHGPFRWRIIFTIYHNRELRSWTGRAVAGDGLRYRALSADPERAKADNLPPAHGVTGDYLLWHDHLMHTQDRTIVLCEGPFDALKIRTLGRNRGITATCFFTTMPTDRQIQHLHRVLPRFERRLLLLDAGTMPIALAVQSKLTPLGVRAVTLAPGIKDPGELDERSFKTLLPALL